jgi:DedD protein
VVLLVAAAVVLPLVLESSPPGEWAASGPGSVDPPDSSPDRIRITTFDGVEDGRLGHGPGEEAEVSAVSAAPPGAAVPADGWAVQIGSFADPGNAERLREQVASRGYRAITQRVTNPEGKSRVRVLVGPDRTRPAAAARLSQLQRDSIPGFLVRFPG